MYISDLDKTLFYSYLYGILTYLGMGKLLRPELQQQLLPNMFVQKSSMNEHLFLAFCMSWIFLIHDYLIFVPCHTKPS